MGILDRISDGLDRANAGLQQVTERMQRDIDAAPPKSRGLQQVAGPIGWLHRHDVAARLIFLVSMLGSVILAGVAAGHGAGDAVVYSLLGLAVLSLLLVLWLSLYGGDAFIF